MVSFKGKKILIADDEEDIRELLKDIFSLFDGDISIAENGVIAFNMLKTQKFDILISDIRMPGGDGIELLKNIKSNLDLSLTPKLFLCTGYSDLQEEQTKSLGVIEIFHKPFDTKYLISAVEKALNI